MKKRKPPQKTNLEKSTSPEYPKYILDFDIHKTTVNDLSHLSPPMQEIIKQGYKIFSQYTVPRNFTICAPCCVSDEEIYALKTIPLHRIPTPLMRSYNQGSSGPQTDINEVRYLLPRLLELLAAHEHLHVCTELNLDRLTQVDHSQWLKNERQLLADFSRQYLIDSFKDSAQNSKMTAVSDILTMFAKAKFELMPLLEIMTEVTEFYGFVSIAYFVIQDLDHNGCFNNSFVSDMPELGVTMNQWLLSAKPQLKRHAEIAILNLEDQLSDFSPTYQFYIEQSLCELQNR